MTEILIAALLLLAPNYLTPETAGQNARAAVAASKATGVPAELLLAIAYHESNFNPKALSRWQGHRVTTPWDGVDAPPDSKSYFCG